MGKQEELIKLDRTVKDTQLRLRTFETNINAIKKELDFLYNVEKQLEENIAYLKNVKIVALAIEYKKAKEDLKKTKTRISQLKMDLSINEKSYKDIEKLFEKAKEAYDKLSSQDENNVVMGKFGRKNV